MRCTFRATLTAMLTAAGLSAQQTPPATQPTGEVVFLAAEADQPPRFDSVQTWYFPHGKLGQSARVVFQVVINTRGRVVPETISLVSTSDTAFVQAARLSMMVAFYHPATSRGEPVAVLARQALTFDKRASPQCELPPVAPTVPEGC